MHALIFLLLILSGCSQKEMTKEKPLKTVEVAPVISQRTPIWLNTVGNVVPMITVEVTPQVEGKIIEIPIKEGQRVSKGDLLYKIDPKPYEAALLKAQGNYIKEEANLKYQQQRLERFGQLLPDEYISKINIEEIESALGQAKGAVETARGQLKDAEIHLNYCNITSPIDGKISKYAIEYGNIVSKNDANALTVIRQITPVQIQFSYPQKDFEALQKEGAHRTFPIEIKLLQDADYKYRGEVFFYDNTISAETGTILLKGIYPNDNEELWPGEFVRVRLLLKWVENALLVPIEAVQKGQNGLSLFVLKTDQTVELRQIKIGAQANNHYIVENGVEKGEIVVTKGQLNLQPGDQVQVVGDK